MMLTFQPVVSEVCRGTQEQVRMMGDWNKQQVHEHYAKHKDLRVVLAHHGFEGDISQHRLPRARVNPSAELLDAVFSGCFQVEDKRMSLRAFRQDWGTVRSLL